MYHQAATVDVSDKGIDSISDCYRTHVFLLMHDHHLPFEGSPLSKQLGVGIETLLQAICAPLPADVPC